MKFPEFLWKLRPGEAGRQHTDLVNVFMQVSGLFTTLNASPLYVVPADAVLCLANACARALPGAAQTCSDLLMQYVAPNTGQQYHIASDSPGATSGTYRGLNWSGEIYIPPGCTVLMSASFSAAAASNQLQASLAGVLIPRGTFVWRA